MLIVVKAFKTDPRTDKFSLELSPKDESFPKFGYVSWTYQSESILLWKWELHINNRRLGWKLGRQQDSCYWKLKLFESKKFEFDVYLLKFENRSWVNPHIDPVIEGKEHHRINIILRRPTESGGVTFVDGFPVKSRAYKFRPDTQYHELITVRTHHKRPMYMLSIGWLKNVKKTS